MTDFLEDLPEFFVTSEFATDIKIDGVEAKGIYTPAFEDAFGIETRGKELLVQESVSNSIGVSHESIVEIITGISTASTYHRVRGIEPDGTGLTVLTLENDPTDFVIATENLEPMLTEFGLPIKVE